MFGPAFCRALLIWTLLNHFFSLVSAAVRVHEGGSSHLKATRKTTSEVIGGERGHNSRILNEAIYPDDQPVLTSSDGELRVTLSIGEATYENLDTGLEQKIVGYNGLMGGPTLRVRPGDTLHITLQNNLPPEACNTSVPDMWNQYHAISETNLHVHGVFVPAEENPTFLKISPGEEHEYTINIPEMHQGGTNWYHPHVAGSTTLQAGGGALGLLIVEDLEGDVPPEVANLPEVNMRIQFFNFTYLQYDYATGTEGSYVELCRQFCLPAENRDNCTEPFFENGPTKGQYNTTLAPDGLEYETLTINGVEKPTIELTAGQWYRFRTLYVPTRFRTIEPAIEGCDFKLLAKDGKYLPVAPRDIESGYLFSGSRADFLVRCMEEGTYEFQSLSETLDSSNWVASQKRPSLARTMAHLQVTAAAEPPVEPVEIPQFKVARPCYLPDMLNVMADEETYIIQSGLTPPLGPNETLPEIRPEWSSGTINYYAINNYGTHDPPSPDYGVVAEPDFVVPLGSIWEIDYFVPQIHPFHAHIFSYQVVQQPAIDSHQDYFQVGDYHDTLIFPVSDQYSKAVLRSHLATYPTELFAHCHFYRHSDRGMAILGQVVGEAGTLSPKATDCYVGLEGREYELVDVVVVVDDDQQPTPTPGTSAPTTPESTTTTTAPVGGGDVSNPSPTDAPSEAPGRPLCQNCWFWWIGFAFGLQWIWFG